MKDILPQDAPYWNAVRMAVDDLARGTGFQRIEPPILEAASLFTRSVGQETDIVDKEMYTFIDKGGDKVALRPELTAAIARAYLEHGMLSWPQPVKLFYLGPFFRHDRPQAGRYRQFWQFGFEVLGDGHPVIDAQLIYDGVTLYRTFNVPVIVHINSIGDAACRPGYLKQLTEYFRSRRHSLCEDCKKRLLKNPLRIFDCKVPDCHLVAQDAPQIVDHLCEPCKDHFVRVLEYLGELDVPYTLNPRIVRGLDYYTRTAFEFVEEGTDDGPAQTALGGGGRYDGLIEQLGGPDTPACGWAAGVERMLLAAGDRPVAAPLVDLYLAVDGGEAARLRAFRIGAEARRAGLAAQAELAGRSLKGQLKQASRLSARYVAIVDDTGQVRLKDMDAAEQQDIADIDVVAQVLRGRGLR